MDQFGFKEFEAVSLKATYDIEIAGRTIEPGEVIAHFDKIQIAGLQENIKRVSANGGFDNRAHVYWETTKEMPLAFSQGVFSKEQFAILTNARLVNKSENEVISVPFRETLESNENGLIQCKYEPKTDIFVYDAQTSRKLKFGQNGDQLDIGEPYKEVIVTYNFDYNNGVQILKIGNRLITGFISLEGRTRIKDDTTGRVVTGIIRVPQLKLMSELSIRLGAQANPVVGNFNGVGVPVGSRGSSYVSEFYILNDDITSDL